MNQVAKGLMVPALLLGSKASRKVEREAGLFLRNLARGESEDRLGRRNPEQGNYL